MISLGLWLLALGVSVAQAPSIFQQTQGYCSPAVGQTGGNVNITCQGVDPEAMQRLNERLNKANLDLEQKKREANEWARKYHELSQQAEIMQDKKVTPRAKDFLREGRLEDADALLRRSTISMAQYHAIQTGMSYPEVVNILGRPGVEISRGGNIVNYAWINPDGSQLGVLFANGQAGPKSQGGLR
jgi:hypothetical protein